MEPRPKVAITSLAKPRFLWWRFALIVFLLSVLGWGYSAAWYCYPTPSEREQAVFFLLLLVILIQTFKPVGTGMMIRGRLAICRPSGQFCWR